MKRKIWDWLPFLKRWKETFWDRLAPAMGLTPPPFRRGWRTGRPRGNSWTGTGGCADFTPGEPKTVRYRLEPLAQQEKAPDQHRRELFEELGCSTSAP